MTETRFFARSSICVCMLLLSALGSSHGAAKVIGDSSKIILDDRAIRTDQIFNQPADGAVVTLNPPQFSWRFSPTNGCNDQEERLFVFQASYSPSFSPLIFNITTPINFYNFLDHFTNSPVYWRVAYLLPTNSTTTNWSVNRRFTIASNAVVWDRSAMTDYDGAMHPSVLFRSNDINSLTNTMGKNAWWRYAMSNFRSAAADAQTNWFGMNYFNLTTNQSTLVYYPSDVALNFTNELGAISEFSKSYPNAVFKSYYYPTGTNVVAPDYSSRILCYTNAQSWTNGDVYSAQILRLSGYHINGLAYKLALASMHWQLRHDTALTNRMPELMEWFAKAEVASGMENSDYYDNGMQHLALAYDMFFDLLSESQKNTITWALSRRAQYYLNRAGLYTGTNSTNFKNRAANKGSLMRSGESHTYAQLTGMVPLALASLGASSTNRQLYDLVVNYNILRLSQTSYESGIDRGRGYAEANAGSLGTYRIHPILAVYFRTNGWTNHPGLKTFPRFFSFLKPVGMRLNGDDTWGDGGNGQLNNELYRLDAFWVSPYAMFASSLSASGSAEYHRQRSLASWPSSIRPEDNLPFDLVNVPYFYPQPVAVPDTNTAVIYPLDGWVMAYANPPSTHQTNNVGFIFQARPVGGDQNHTFASDLDLDLMAYGTRITEGGGAYGSTYAQTSLSRNRILVDNKYANGSGECAKPRTSSQLLAYEQGSNYVYTAGSISSNYYNAGWITRNDRHVLFMRNKYWVIYDNLASLSNSTYAWTWHLREPTLTNVSSAGFSYTCSNLFYGGASVSNLVRHIASTNSLGSLRVDRGTTASDGSGYTNKILNHPFTGERFNNGGYDNVRSSALYVTNRIPSRSWHFMTVVYPVRFGDPMPTITRLDDNTVAITNGSDGDVISFDTNQTFRSTLVIDLGATNAAPRLVIPKVEGVRLNAPAPPP